MAAWISLCLLLISADLCLNIKINPYEPQPQPSQSCEKHAQELDALIESLIDAIKGDELLYKHTRLYNIIEDYLHRGKLNANPSDPLVYDHFVNENEYSLPYVNRPFLKQKFVSDNFVEESGEEDFPPTNEVIQEIFKDIKILFRRKTKKRIPVGEIEDILLRNLRPFIIFPIVKPCRKENVDNMLNFVRSAYLRFIETPCYDNIARSGNANNAKEDKLQASLGDYIWQKRAQSKSPKRKSCQTRAFDYFLETIKIIVQLFIKNYDCHPEDDYNAPPVNEFDNVFPKNVYKVPRNYYADALVFPPIRSEGKTKSKKNLLKYLDANIFGPVDDRKVGELSYLYNTENYQDSVLNPIRDENVKTKHLNDVGFGDSFYPTLSRPKNNRNTKIPYGKDSALVGPVRDDDDYLRNKGDNVHLYDGAYGDMHYPYYATELNQNYKNNKEYGRIPYRVDFYRGIYGSNEIKKDNDVKLNLNKQQSNYKIHSGRDSVLVGPVRDDDVDLRNKGYNVHLNDGGYGDMHYPYYATELNQNAMNNKEYGRIPNRVDFYRPIYGSNGIKKDNNVKLNLNKQQSNYKIPSGKDSVLVGPVRDDDDDLRNKGNNVHLNDGGYGDMHYPYYATELNQKDNHNKKYGRIPKLDDFYRSIYGSNEIKKDNNVKLNLNKQQSSYKIPSGRDSVLVGPVRDDDDDLRNKGYNVHLNDGGYGDMHYPYYATELNKNNKINKEYGKIPNHVDFYRPIYGSNGIKKDNNVKLNLNKQQSNYKIPSGKDSVLVGPARDDDDDLRNKGNNVHLNDGGYGDMHYPYYATELQNDMNNKEYGRMPNRVDFYRSIYGSNEIKKDNNLKTNLNTQQRNEELNSDNSHELAEKNTLLDAPVLDVVKDSTKILDPNDMLMDLDDFKNSNNHFAAFGSLISRPSVELPSYDKSTNKTADIEVVYVVRHPRVLLYNPQFVVKQTMAYETYLKNLKEIFNAKHFGPDNEIQLLKVLKRASNGEVIPLYQSKEKYEPLHLKDFNLVNRLTIEESLSKKPENQFRSLESQTEKPPATVEDVAVSTNTTLRDADAATHESKQLNEVVNAKAKPSIQNESKGLKSAYQDFADETRSSPEQAQMAPKKARVQAVHYYGTPSYDKIVNTYKMNNMDSEHALK